MTMLDIQIMGLRQEVHELKSVIKALNSYNIYLRTGGREGEKLNEVPSQK